ncbi:heparan-alpha-glucosaminide N-acetyltransferase [Yimella sp. cx-51]|uniref:heparan-alpha-glucosaminide N-acetyltransferase n=1 Tax=Yimella sp. cx-51 TaxID=2770551 RepID=UPI00165D5761|nr:heparan-alpha-glucosaminide N-acetyltransferase [Yimella sp. cx-51]MBC9957516.1 DUF1624 domain-containing protein [Yimella sp. cx-51]QTH39256.1 DUF1624 domain-containing protein [Yimella sp. cx-51]
MSTVTDLQQAALRHVGKAPRRSRWAVIDVLRGVAIVAVVLFHLVWDLGHFGLMDHWTRTPAGRMTGHVIAGTFLFLTGFSLVLASRGGVKARPFLRRLGKLLACAYAITFASVIIAPPWLVTFGILHDIALTSVLLLPFLRGSKLIAMGAALLSFALPAMISIDSTSRWLTWTGLTPTLSPSLDVQPLFPLFGVSLLGVVLARLVIERAQLESALASWASADPLSTTMQRWGRHTLAIYLLHQPVLFGLLNLLIWTGLITPRA